MKIQCYNNRNSRGQFTKSVRRAKDGKFARTLNIVPGRLYSYKGIIVRAHGKDRYGNRFISAHKTLYGTIYDSQLSKINATKVKNYLVNT